MILSLFVGTNMSLVTQRMMCSASRGERIWLTWKPVALSSVLSVTLAAGTAQPLDLVTWLDFCTILIEILHTWAVLGIQISLVGRGYVRRAREPAVLLNRGISQAGFTPPLGRARRAVHSVPHGATEMARLRCVGDA